MLLEQVDEPAQEEGQQGGRDGELDTPALAFEGKVN